jgi:Domain of unknown function (DUF4276)
VHIEFLVEDLSTREALLILLPKMLHSGTEYEIHAFRGKQDLFSKLPSRLKGYAGWIPEEWRIVILVDRDNEDCQELKKKLEQFALDSGFITKTRQSNRQPFRILNRIMIEELEAWFFGDAQAILKAYPGIPNFSQKAKYREPDAIQGGTWEALERELQKAGHFRGGLDKVEAARKIAKFMDPKINRSASFQVFYQGLLNLVPIGK